MENKTKITYGIVGLLLTIVATLGGTVYLNPDQLDHAYICTVNDEIGIFEKLSSTMKTGYWFDENGIEQSKVCRNGVWLNLKQYAKDTGIDINVYLEGMNDVVPEAVFTGKQYLCNSQKCEVIK